MGRGHLWTGRTAVCPTLTVHGDVSLSSSRSIGLFLALLSLSIACQEVSPTGVSGATFGREAKGGEAPVEMLGPEEQPQGGAPGTNAQEEELRGETFTDCSREAKQIVARVNLHRQNNGRTEIALSRSLCAVAEAHVTDLIENQPYAAPGCSPNSWSSRAPVGACCYRDDSSNPECMWDKPEQLTGYPALGFESVAIHVANANEAFIRWRDEPGHSALMLNSGQWVGTPWQAVGAAYRDGHATLWFGESLDPGSSVP